MSGARGYGSSLGMLRVPARGIQPIATFQGNHGSYVAATGVCTPGAPELVFGAAPAVTQVAFLFEAKGFTKWNFYITGDSTVLPIPAGAGNGVFIFGTLAQTDIGATGGVPSGIAGSTNTWFLLAGDAAQAGTGTEKNPMFNNGDQLEYGKTLFAVGFAVVGATGISSSHPIQIWGSATP